MHITTESDIEKVTNLASQLLSDLLAKYQNEPTLFLTSAGSALNLLKNIDPKVLSSNLTIGILDERFSRDPRVNNFLQFKLTSFYKNAAEKGCTFINSFPEDNETQETFSQKLDHVLKKWRTESPNGKVLATLGIGTDGHTSGIMPYPENPQLFSQLFESDHWMIGYDARNKNEYPLRVTTTLTFLSEVIDHTVCFFVGENKREAYQKIIADKLPLNVCPGLIVYKMKDVHIFTSLTL